jgi:AtzE family amidohydrolase
VEPTAAAAVEYALGRIAERNPSLNAFTAVLPERARREAAAIDAAAAERYDPGPLADTNGSIRVPASFCGVFGMKPTFGRLPRTGTFPFVHDLDHLGVFTRKVANMALVYDLLQGYSEGDLACVRRRIEPTLPLIAGPFSARVAVLGGWFEDLADEQGRDAVRLAAQALGATATVSLPGAAQARAAAFLLTCASGGNLHIDALRTRADDFDPATRDRLLAGALLSANPILQAQRFRAVFHEQALSLFRDVDLLLAPATPCSAPLLGQPTIRVAGEDLPTRPNIGLLTQPLSFIGLPIVAAPVRNGAMPIAVQLIAPPWREDLALTAAATLERAGVASGPQELPA